MASIAEKLQIEFFNDWIDVSNIFPSLAPSCLNSPPDASYNCIAWAANQTDVWWWPSPFILPGYYWPPDVPANTRLDSFYLAYKTLGYEVIREEDIDDFLHVIAIMGKDENNVCHAMKRLSDGRWSSKLGKSFDIIHDLHELDGVTYGHVIGFVGKSRKK